MPEHYFTIELIDVVPGLPAYIGDDGILAEDYARRWDDLFEAYRVASALRDILGFQSNVIAYDARTGERVTDVATPNGIAHEIRNH